jgi:hypothetical protein
MSKEIKAGDRVMVVRWPHRHGPARCVALVERITPGAVCGVCCTTWLEPSARFEGGGGAPVSWLKKIDPDEDPDAIETEREREKEDAA